MMRHNSTPRVAIVLATIAMLLSACSDDTTP